MSLYEVEIKSLLGGQDKADSLVKHIEDRGGKLVSQTKQLNHYFVLSDKALFEKNFLAHINASEQDEFKKVLTEGTDFSVRTREVDGKVLLVIKASLGDGSGANGVSRIEFEADMSMSLEELDNLLLASGLEQQAKWSRERTDYTLGDTKVSLDKNAGYGYLAEFEQVVSDKSLIDQVKQELLDLMNTFGVSELPQDRLERMFAHYNSNWREYYGTDKVFNIE